MRRTANILIALSIYLAGSLMLVSQASYATDAGHAQFVNGSVQITSATGQESVLNKGDVVKEGDTLTTAKDASAQIKMLDGGLIAVRPETKLKFDNFKFNGTQDGSERSFFSLFKGGFRAVTGLIGQINKSSFRITTAAATIGIRGTDHETFVVTSDSPLAAMEPIGTYNKVNRGSTTMTTAKGTIFVLPNQMGFVGAADQMPELKPVNTRIFTVSDRPLIGTKEMNSGETTMTTTKDTISVLPDQTGFVGAADQMPELKSDNTEILTVSDKPLIGTKADKKDGKEGSNAAAVNKTKKKETAGKVTATNWGILDSSIKITNSADGEVTTHAREDQMTGAANPTKSAAAKQPDAGADTHGNSKQAASANSPNTMGASPQDTNLNVLNNPMTALGLTNNGNANGNSKQDASANSPNTMGASPQDTNLNVLSTPMTAIGLTNNGNAAFNANSGGAKMHK